MRAGDAVALRQDPKFPGPAVSQYITVTVEGTAFVGACPDGARHEDVYRHLEEELAQWLLTNERIGIDVPRHSRAFSLHHGSEMLTASMWYVSLAQYKAAGG